MKDERPDLIGYGEGIRQAEDVDVFTGFGEGITSEENWDV